MQNKYDEEKKKKKRKEAMEHAFRNMIAMHGNGFKSALERYQAHHKTNKLPSQ